MQNSSFNDFGDIFNQIFGTPTYKSLSHPVGGSWPPYDVIQKSDTITELVFAVAGLSKEDIEVSFKKGDTGELEIKTVDSDSTEKEDDVDYIHQGIARRSFIKVFTTNRHAVVNSAKVENGLLTIELEVKVPKELQPKKITIK